MRLSAVRVTRFRSIKDEELVKCGDFNVIIGKNNSGKSNILSAINAFFGCINENSIVTLDPPIGKTIDFFNKNFDSPIEITLTFSLLLSERDALLQDIATEIPEMRHATEGIDPSLLLSISVNIINTDNPRAYISKITIESVKEDNFNTKRTILYLRKEAGLELLEKVHIYNQRLEEREILLKAQKRIDNEDWDRMALRETRGVMPLRSMIVRIMPDSSSSELVQKIEGRMIEKSYEAFIRATESIIQDITEATGETPEPLQKNRISTFTGEATSVPKYVMNLLRKVSELKVLYLTEQRKQIGKEEAERLLSLKVQRGGTKILQNIQEVVASLLGVQVDAFQGLKSRNSSSRVTSSFPTSGTNAELDVDNFLVEVNGSGIREALRLILDYEFQQPDILLVEEPEVHLHPALETSMMRYLKQISDKCQVFVSTHSTNFLDTPEMKNVYLVSKSTSTQIQALNFEDAQVQLPKELGIRLSSLFMFDRLVFVEGPSDAAIIREWASLLRINLSKHNVGFITMGGARNFTHYAAQATLSFLAKRQVNAWFLIDKDERDDLDITRLKELLGEEASVKVLDKREVENYLLQPHAIVKFIKLKRELASLGNSAVDLDLTEENIKKLIEDCSEELKQLTINKLVARRACRTIHPSLKWDINQNYEASIVQRVIDENQKIIKKLEEEIQEVENIYKAETSYIDKVWQTCKLDLVPGDLLLDIICKKYGVRYKKELDGQRLAALMEENEIDPEIKEIISEIGN